MPSLETLKLEAFSRLRKLKSLHDEQVREWPSILSGKEPEQVPARYHHEGAK
jgi:hypothetical protein